jgi:hypothetical protein
VQVDDILADIRYGLELMAELRESAAGGERKIGAVTEPDPREDAQVRFGDRVVEGLVPRLVEVLRLHLVNQ